MNPVKEKRQSFGRTLLSCALHTYFLMSRGLTLGVRAIVRSDEGTFLLVRHIYTPGWHFPGGGVEKGESSEDALRKELHQETGLKLSGKPILHGVFYNNGVSKRDHVVVYLCEVEGVLPNSPASMEIAEVGFFALDSLPDGTDSGTVRRIREIVDGKTQSEAW